MSVGNSFQKIIHREHSTVQVVVDQNILYPGLHIPYFLYDKELISISLFLITSAAFCMDP